MAEQEQEFIPKIAVYLGTYYQGSKKLYGYLFLDPDRNTGEPVEDDKVSLWAKPLHQGKATPGSVYEIGYRENEEHVWVRGGERPYRGRWQATGQAMRWEIYDTARSMEYKVHQLAAKDQNTSPLKSHLDAIRQTLRTLSPDQRRVMVAWILDYLLRW